MYWNNLGYKTKIIYSNSRLVYEKIQFVKMNVFLHFTDISFLIFDSTFFSLRQKKR